MGRMKQPSPPFPNMAKWQADAFGHRKHISSWGWEGREGSTCATIAPPFHNESALSPPFQILLSVRQMLLCVASTSLAGAGRGGRAAHRWVRFHISIERVSVDQCMMQRHTITVMPAKTSAIAVMSATTNYPPSHSVQLLLKSAVVGGQGNLL